MTTQATNERALSREDAGRWYGAHVELDHYVRTAAASTVEAITSRMREVLEGAHAAVGVSPRGWLDTQLSVQAVNLSAACSLAATMTIGAAAQAGVAAEVIACEVMTESEFEVRQGWTRLIKHQDHEQGEDVLTTRQVAELLGVSGPRVRQLVESGQLPSRALNTRARTYRRADVEAFKLKRAGRQVATPPA